jgi:hypothetical protein
MVWSQYGAALDMLDNAITACPESLWSDTARTPQYWYLVYHTLFFLDYYSSGSPRGFAPPEPFTLAELDPAGVMPDRIYTREELRRYLGYGRAKAMAEIEALTDERAARRADYDRPGLTVAELMLQSLRHVQHHTAQLNLILRQVVDAAPGWVTKSSRPLGG